MMKKLTKVAMLMASAALAAQGVYAGSANDLVLGINNNDQGGANDYIIDLGSLTTLSATANTPINLCVSVATLISDLGTGPAGWDLGVVGGKTGGLSAVGNDVYSSTTRIGGGSPAVAGTESAANNVSVSAVVNAGGVGSTIGKNGTLGSVPSSQTTPTSFTAGVAKDSTSVGTSPGNFFADLGGTANPNADPLQVMGAAKMIILDLWKNTVTSSSATSGWVYQGDLLIDLSGQQATAVFDQVPVTAVPESSTYGVLAGAGLLALCLSRQLRRQTA